MIRLNALRVKWIVDEDPDLSWLDTELSEDGKTIISSCRYTQDELDQHPIRTRRYIREDRERLNSYGDQWYMLGCIAEAEVSYKIGDTNDYRLEHLTSGGLWGIESDCDEPYKESIAKDEELQDLKQHLQKFGVEIPEDWDGLASEAVDRMHNTETRRDSNLSQWVIIDE